MRRPDLWPGRSAWSTSGGPASGSIKEREPALRVRPHQQRVHRHLRPRLRAPARLPDPDAALHGRSVPGDRPDSPVLPREPRSVVARKRRRLGSGGVLPGDPGRPQPVRRRRLRRHVRGLPAEGARGEGGAALIPYAEDVHTGLNVMRDGWSITYLPIVLATGICPNNLDAFVRQQYRWCACNLGIVCDAGGGRCR